MVQLKWYSAHRHRLGLNEVGAVGTNGVSGVRMENSAEHKFLSPQWTENNTQLCGIWPCTLLQVTFSCNTVFVILLA